MLDPNFGVGGLSGVLLPKTQAIFGEEGNETTWFVETEVIFILDFVRFPFYFLVFNRIQSY